MHIGRPLLRSYLTADVEATLDVEGYCDWLSHVSPQHMWQWLLATCHLELVQVSHPSVPFEYNRSWSNRLQIYANVWNTTVKRELAIIFNKKVQLTYIRDCHKLSIKCVGRSHNEGSGIVLSTSCFFSVSIIESVPKYGFISSVWSPVHFVQISDWCHGRYCLEVSFLSSKWNVTSFIRRAYMYRKCIDTLAFQVLNLDSVWGSI